MAQTWHDLLFAHWPVPTAVLRPYVPAALELDTFESQAWLGVVPFRMSGVRPRFLPPVPGLSAFPELNLRTYVTHGEKPGVWFFSLDAANRVAVRVARGAFHLPYFDARMTCTARGETVEYHSERTHRGAPPAVLHGRYGPTGPVELARPGTLDAWLTERYCLYAARERQLWRGEIHHAPWPLQPAEAELDECSMTRLIGSELPATDPLLHFARRIDVVVWRPYRVDGTRS